MSNEFKRIEQEVGEEILDAEFEDVIEADFEPVGFFKRIRFRVSGRHFTILRLLGLISIVGLGFVLKPFVAGQLVAVCAILTIGILALSLLPLRNHDQTSKAKKVEPPQRLSNG